MLAGCAPDDASDERIGSSDWWIINGQVDTSHDAVVAIFAQQSGCTATIVHVDGVNVYVLTAAHCFGFGAIELVVVGDDYNAPEQVLTVTNYQVHPQYNPSDSTYDFAMITANGASGTLPVIPALRPTDDVVAVGTSLDHVGYGLTYYPSGQTSVRHHAIGSVAQLAITQIGYEQPVSGPCSGDSGGPNLVTTPNGERVAGVISYGDEQCAAYGVSGRVTAVYDNFIGPYTGNPEPTTTTTTTTSTGTTTGVGGGTGTSAGAGASDNWVAGDMANREFDGDVRSGNGCSAGGASDGPAWPLLLALAGLLRRRREES